jgi:hypothetical protein
VVANSRFDDTVRARAEDLAARSDRPDDETDIALAPLERAIDANGARYRHVTVEFDLGVIQFKTAGDPAMVVAHDGFLETHAAHCLMREILLLWKRVLKRIDVTARSLAALIEPAAALPAPWPNSPLPATAPRTGSPSARTPPAPTAR